MKHNDFQKKIYLIDGSSFLYRAYYAIKPLKAPDGNFVQAVYGFCRMINKIINDYQPAYCGVVWDSKGKTARHDLYHDYKATRQAPPSDLFYQKELIIEFLNLIGLYQIMQPGVEADDIIACMAKNFAAQGYSVVIVTSDKDLAQVVGHNIVIFDPFKNVTLDQQAIEQKYGFPVKKLPFYFALLGDNSDNIPGVHGIGPQGAQKIVQNFDSLDDLYNNIDQAGSLRIQTILLNHKDNAFLSEKLFLFQPCDVALAVDDLEYVSAERVKARTFFERLNFKSLSKDLPKDSLEDHQSFAQRYGYTFITVTHENDLKKLCDQIKATGSCALDTETTSLNVFRSNLVGISICCGHGVAYYIPCGHTTGEFQLSREIIIAALKPIFEDGAIKKYFHNAKFDRSVLSRFGIDLKGIAFDTMVAAGLVNKEGNSLSLKALSLFYLYQAMFSFQQMVTDRKLDSFAQVTLEKATDYAASDAHQTWCLVSILQNKLKEYEQEHLYYFIEHPLIEVLYAMESVGVIVDQNVLLDINARISKELNKLVQEIMRATSENDDSINLNSPAQVGRLLFETLGLTPLKKNSKSGTYSTDSEVLHELARYHPVPGLIVRYRELYKLKSTYVDALPNYINDQTGRVHTTFWQTSVATGRLSSTDPNLQNIPLNDTDFSLRSAFKSPAGEKFVSADYSQMELRILAHLSQDPALIGAFLNQEDIHTKTAAGLFAVSADQVTSGQRQLAKRINFSILYGLTPYGLSKDLGISLSEAKEYIQAYMGHYPGVQRWMEEVVQVAHDKGYVTTMYGRRRYIPGIYEKNRTLYDLAKRVAINTVVQGSAAEIMKLGMLHVYQELAVKSPDSHIVLQIHDELLITAPEQKIIQIEKTVQNCLEGVVQLRVPIKVDVRNGCTWSDVSK